METQIPAKNRSIIDKASDTDRESDTEGKSLASHTRDLFGLQYIR